MILKKALAVTVVILIVTSFYTPLVQAAEFKVNCSSVSDCIDKGDKLVGGFHLWSEQRKGVEILREPPFTPHIGPFYRSPSDNHNKAQDFQKKISAVLAEFISSLKKPVVSCALHKDIIDTQPFIWEEYKVIPHYTYIIDLSPSEEELWEGMIGDKRTDVRKAEKDEITIESVSDPAVVAELVGKTFSRQEKSVDIETVQAITGQFASEKNSFSFVPLLPKKISSKPLRLRLPGEKLG